ncbi:hypothetical protein F0562_000421 [Nyssa sinensis]|uniref:Uncharacterized protein n=1 Tax=Nyssa sinensis TaxID=561372 RepID=A0A5J5C476_9ASTE|nr:hypothetical protein F0562_000421 [Nyssa sinensis]
MVAVNYQHPDNEWHPDTGATHHLTNDVNNIHLQNGDYDSEDHIQVANGASQIFVSRHVVFDESLYPYTVPTSVKPTPKPAPAVLPPNLNLSPSSSSVSPGTNVQFAAPSPLPMASPSSPQIDLPLGSGSLAKDTTLPQHADSPAHPPFPPRQQHHNMHSMITRSKNNIHKPKLASDSHTRYPIPKALMATI